MAEQNAGPAQPLRPDWLRHEIRNPLNVLVGSLRLIEMGGVTPAQHKQIDACRAAVDRITGILDSLGGDGTPAFVERAAAELRALGGVTFLGKPFERSDLLRDVSGQFDLIIANPPYMLDSQQRTYRHGGGKHGAGLSLAIFDTAMERLAPGGTLLLYTGVAIFAGEDPFLNAIRLSLRDTGWDWDYQEIDPDVFGEELQKPEYAQAERIACVALRLTYQPSLRQR